MESMDYNYFANAAPQPYQYLGYGDTSLLPHSSDGNGAISVSSITSLLPDWNVPISLTSRPQSMETPLDNGFLAGNFDYSHFDPTLSHATGLTPMPTASASPPAQHLAMMSNDSGVGLDMENEPTGRRSSSEEKDGVVTPAQSRRKAQNRAAQRAFRERKERHVRDLEAKLNLLTTTTSSLQSDNERLKLMLQRAQTENEILRATASSSPSARPPSFVDDVSGLPSLRAAAAAKASPATDHELRMDPTRLAHGLLSTESSASPSKYGSPGSESHLLSASATWDLLQSHPLYLSGAVNIGEVCERLKKMARCDGMGPMFEEDEVRKVIEEVGRSGGDELI